jgi:putative pyruvate formate lyase activating enzyme
MKEFNPSYLKLHLSGELFHRAIEAQTMLAKCTLCGWECGVDRIKGETGQCFSGHLARVSSFFPHHGEEKPISGMRGSGTIFFSRCNLHCVFCQNYDISQMNSGKEVSSKELADMMLILQEQGCHNINLVSPTHVVPHILSALLIAVDKGFHLPLVYNTGGYDSLKTLKLLDGIVDIYMPDMKYADEANAQQYSKIPHYPKTNQAAVKEMHHQVGDLVQDEHGIALHGLLVRHLVLPSGIAGSEQIIKFLAEEISTHAYLNLMDQYRPEYHAYDYPQINRPITQDEYQQALRYAVENGLTRLDARIGSGNSHKDSMGGTTSPYKSRFT